MVDEVFEDPDDVVFYEILRGFSGNDLMMN
jgi:hypothetical protein